MKHTIRVATKQTKEGVEVVVLDARTGREASRHIAKGGTAESDIKAIRDAFLRNGERVDVVER